MANNARVTAKMAHYDYVANVAKTMVILLLSLRMARRGEARELREGVAIDMASCRIASRGAI